VGSHIAEFLLKKNHDILIITKTFSKKQNIRQIKDKVRIEKVDITNLENWERLLRSLNHKQLFILQGIHHTINHLKNHSKI